MARLPLVCDNQLYLTNEIGQELPPLPEALAKPSWACRWHTAYMRAFPTASSSSTWLLSMIPPWSCLLLPNLFTSK